MMPQADHEDEIVSLCGAPKKKNPTVFFTRKPFYIRFRSNQMISDTGFSLILATESTYCTRLRIIPTETITVQNENDNHIPGYGELA